LNDDGTKGFAGGIDGSEVVFQQSSQRRSDIRIYDTSSGHNVHVPTGVNTKEWEWGPMMSGTFMLFGRERFTRTRYAMRIILHNTATGHETVLDGARGHFGNKGPYVIPGQVNGDYATWQRCDVTNSCDVFVRKISSAHDVRLPDHGQEYAPSVASDGAVFFVRSRRGCGTEARLMRYEHGSATLVRDFARNRDSFETYAVSSTQVVREVNNCKTGDSNINLTTIT
jgi:hypothetical protein